MDVPWEKTLLETYVATLPISLFSSNSLVAFNIYLYVTTQWVTITNFGLMEFGKKKKYISKISYDYNQVFYVYPISLLMHFARYVYVTLNLHYPYLFEISFRWKLMGIA